MKQWWELSFLVADPGVPAGGAVDSRGEYVSKILYVETKESGPLGGTCAGHAPSRSASAFHKISLSWLVSQMEYKMKSQ